MQAKLKCLLTPCLAAGGGGGRGLSKGLGAGQGQPISMNSPLRSKYMHLLISLRGAFTALWGNLPGRRMKDDTGVLMGLCDRHSAQRCQGNPRLGL